MGKAAAGDLPSRLSGTTSHWILFKWRILIPSLLMSLICWNVGLKGKGYLPWFPNYCMSNVPIKDT